MSGPTTSWIMEYIVIGKNIDMKYDYLIVGSGFFGSICAHELKKAGKGVVVIENRDHIGGNCYTENRDGINLHMYGPHIFHTSNEAVWKWINQFVEFNNYRYNPVAFYQGKIYSLPFNMWTFYQLWGEHEPHRVQQIIEERSQEILEPKNLEEQAIKLVGREVYETLIEGYTTKQWMKHPRNLPKHIIKRLPVRFTFDTNYFFDKYQGIPIGGYTQIFEKLLEGVDIRLSTDYFTADLPEHDKVIYTGPIDKYFNYLYGELEYKTTRFIHKYTFTPNYQGVAVVNYTDIAVDHTRIIEHKHFEGVDTPSSWVTWEYPEPYQSGVTEPYYPVNDVVNNTMYNSYRIDALKIQNEVVFGGRLGEYKYYDMDAVITSALTFIKKEIESWI